MPWRQELAQRIGLHDSEKVIQPPMENGAFALPRAHGRPLRSFVWVAVLLIISVVMALWSWERPDGRSRMPKP
jgi:hypothetical protein